VLWAGARDAGHGPGLQEDGGEGGRGGGVVDGGEEGGRERGKGGARL